MILNKTKDGQYTTIEYEFHDIEDARSFLDEYGDIDGVSGDNRSKTVTVRYDPSRQFYTNIQMGLWKEDQWNTNPSDFGLSKSDMKDYIIERLREDEENGVFVLQEKSDSLQGCLSSVHTTPILLTYPNDSIDGRKNEWVRGNMQDMIYKNVIKVVNMWPVNSDPVSEEPMRIAVELGYAAVAE